MKAAHHNCEHNMDLCSQVHGVLAFWDFAAAFPSVMHQWINLVFKFRKIPEGFLNFIDSLDFMNSAHGNSAGEVVFLYWYLSGVLQGCPASAFIFDVSLDPFLAAFDAQIAQTGRGVVRACADDIGAALASYRHLKYFHPIFAKASEIAGLRLKPPKCNLVPTSIMFSEEIVRTIGSWLRKHIPEWQNFQVVPAAKYLGFYLGPAAGSLQFLSTLRKYKSRAYEIGNSGAPASIAAYLYNCNVSACCSTLRNYLLFLFLPDTQREQHYRRFSILPRIP